MFSLETARAAAELLVVELEPFCEKVTIAGSIRRQKHRVHDIDIVCIPANQGLLAGKLHQMGLKGGSKVGHLTWHGIPVDIYFATPETWATLLLIRTGSKAHNIRLCSLALDKGMRLHADGRGLFDALGKRVAGGTEESIFRALGLPFRHPRERG